MQYTSFVVAPHPLPGRRLQGNGWGACHAFFKKSQFERLLRNHLFQLTAKVFDLVNHGRIRCVPSQPSLVSLHEVFRPFVIDAFTPLGIMLCMTLLGSGWHSSAMLSSPRNPSKMILIFSSDE